ncbi:MAG: hypothetical protein HY458_02365 [Parcubacteria group bacterium]|nr:hypothetical protein [Parcubacteria group bacterium]
MTISQLRTRYPKFFYKGYSYKLQGGDLHVSFDFRVPPDIRFTPKALIKNVGEKNLKRVGKSALNNLVFHLGMMELPSYWKATCSPQIIVQDETLDARQLAWWKNLFVRGLGEFFYQNKIDFTKKNFLAITAEKVFAFASAKHSFRLKNRILVPVGGGKDSAVTLELLKRMDVRPFVLNPKKPQLAIIKRAGGKSPITVLRTIDPKLLELNRKGFLNGHTPFSAYLAFLGALVAALFDYRFVAVSNEKSSNEGNVRYLGNTINHQYSKSFDFEKRFRRYSKQFLLQDLEYFSFLRPLSDLQIAKIFSCFPKYFSVFMSCNNARKTRAQTWCGRCPKCLFTYIIISPFVAQKTLERIFNKNLLKDKSLAPLMGQLTGERGFKPFECVGTSEEVNAALSILDRTKDTREANKILRSWNKRNLVPPALARILKNSLT